MATTAETEDIRPGRLALSVGLPDLPSPEGWKWVKLREIAEMATGHTPSRSNSDYWGGDIPWIKAKDARPVDGGIIDDSNEYTNEKGISNSSAVVLPKGTVCLSRTGSIGYSIILGRPMATSQGFVNWICSDAIVPRFLQALFILERPFLEDIAEGSAHETVYLSEAKAFHVCLPPIEEQRRIANRLDAIQSRTQATGETLDQVPDRIEEYRQSVLNAAFTGRLTADWREDHPDVEPAEALLERLSEERRRRWEENYRWERYDSKGKEPPSGWKDRYSKPQEPSFDDFPKPPDLPNTWEWVSLEALETGDRSTTYGVVKAGDHDPDGVRLLKSGQVRKGFLDLSEVHKISPEIDEEYSRTKLQGGEVLLTLVGASIGRSVVAPDEIAGANVTRAIAVLPLFEELNSWVQHFLSSPHGQLQIREKTTGSAQDVLNLGETKSICIPVPPAEEKSEVIRRLRQRVNKINEMVQHVEQANERLGQLDRSVLAKAFRGELVETEAERARREDRDYETAEELLERVRGESSSKDQNTSSDEQSSTTPQVDENGQFEMKVVEDDPDL